MVSFMDSELKPTEPPDKIVLTTAESWPNHVRFLADLHTHNSPKGLLEGRFGNESEEEEQIRREAVQRLARLTTIMVS